MPTAGAHVLTINVDSLPEAESAPCAVQDWPGFSAADALEPAALDRDRLFERERLAGFS